MKKLFLMLTFLSVTFSQCAYATGFSHYLNKIYQKIGVTGGAGAINKSVGWFTVPIFFLYTTGHAHFSRCLKDWSSWPKLTEIGSNYEKDSVDAKVDPIVPFVKEVLMKNKIPSNEIDAIKIQQGENYCAYYKTKTLVVPETLQRALEGKFESLYPEKMYEELSVEENARLYGSFGGRSNEYTLATADAIILHEFGHLKQTKYLKTRDFFSGVTLAATMQTLIQASSYVIKRKIPTLRYSFYNPSSFLQNALQIAQATGKLFALPVKLLAWFSILSFPERHNEEFADAYMRKHVVNAQDLESLAHAFELYAKIDDNKACKLLKEKFDVDVERYSTLKSYFGRIYAIFSDQQHHSPHSRVQKIRQEIEKRKIEEVQKTIKNL
jgi:hypothetical protein